MDGIERPLEEAKSPSCSECMNDAANQTLIVGGCLHIAVHHVVVHPHPQYHELRDGILDKFDQMHIPGGG